jgi:hypothetical protein
MVKPLVEGKNTVTGFSKKKSKNTQIQVGVTNHCEGVKIMKLSNSSSIIFEIMPSRT